MVFRPDFEFFLIRQDLKSKDIALVLDSGSCSVKSWAVVTLCLDPSPRKTSHSGGQELFLQFGPVALVQERALDSGLSGYSLASHVISCVA